MTRARGVGRSSTPQSRTPHSTAKNLRAAPPELHPGGPASEGFNLSALSPVFDALFLALGRHAPETRDDATRSECVCVPFFQAVFSNQRDHWNVTIESLTVEFCRFGGCYGQFWLGLCGLLEAKFPAPQQPEVLTGLREYESLTTLDDIANRALISGRYRELSMLRRRAQKTTPGLQVEPIILIESASSPSPHPDRRRGGSPQGYSQTAS